MCNCAFPQYLLLPASSLCSSWRTCRPIYFPRLLLIAPIFTPPTPVPHIEEGKNVLDKKEEIFVVCHHYNAKTTTTQRHLSASFECCMKGVSFEAVTQKNFLTSPISRFFVCSQSLEDNIILCNGCLEQKLLNHCVLW